MAARVEIGDGLDGLGGSFGTERARQVADDLVRALLLADRALADGDDDLADEVATGPFRRDLSDRAAAPAPSRTVARALVDVVRDPDDFQAQPRLAITLTGTVDGSEWSATYHVLATTADVRIERELRPG